MSLPIGTRVVVTADKVSHLRNSRYLGAVGTVVDRPSEKYRPNPGENFVDWDREDLSEASASYWTDEALQVIGTSVAPSGLPEIGEDVNYSLLWNRLPLGTVLIDGDGWRHTKIDDWVENSGPERGSGCSTYVDLDGGTGTFGSPWNWGTTVLAYPSTTTTTETQEVTVSDTPTRPKIDFGPDGRKTAREYAAAADSKVLPPPARKILQAAAAGEEVDAYDLNYALTQAMSAAATRYGQSMQRRDLTRKVRHLAYIVQAVLTNHADGLPVYADSGVRSRKVEETQRALDHQAEVNQSLTRDLTDARSTISVLGREVEDLKGSLESEQAKHASTVENLVATDEAWHAAKAEVARLRAIHAYAYGLLDEADRARVQGFEDGLAANA